MSTCWNPAADLFIVPVSSNRAQLVFTLPSFQCCCIKQVRSLMWHSRFTKEVKHIRAAGSLDAHNMLKYWSVSAPFQNKVEIKWRRYIFISSSQRATSSQSCFKNKWISNNVFDVLYLNLYGYLHYSYFPGLGTNPIDMEMGRCVLWQSCRETERLNLKVHSCFHWAAHRFFRILHLRGFRYEGLHANHLKLYSERTQSLQSNVINEKIKTKLSDFKHKLTHSKTYFAGIFNFFVILRLYKTRTLRLTKLFVAQIWVIGLFFWWDHNYNFSKSQITFNLLLKNYL